MSTTDEDKYMDIIQSKAEELDLDVKIRSYYDPADATTVLQVYTRRVNVDGEREKFGGELALSDAVAAKRTMDPAMMIEMQAKQLLHSMREKMEEVYEINGHRIHIFRDKGFSAIDYETGKSWEVSVEDMNGPSTPAANVREGEAFPRTEITRVPEDISDSVKETMFHYVLGWAWTYTPDEYRDMMMYSRYP